MALVLRALAKPAGGGPLVKSVVYDGFDYAIQFAHHEMNPGILKSDVYKARYIGENQSRQHCAATGGFPATSSTTPAKI